MIDKDGAALLTDFGMAGKSAYHSGNFELEIAARLNTHLLEKSIASTTPRPFQSDPSEIVGTIEYVAPEQFPAKNLLDHRFDIYSLGVMLYQFTTGETPFLAKAHPTWTAKEGWPRKRLDLIGAIGHSVMEEPVVLPRTIDPSIPEPLERLIMRLLQTDPDKRPQTVSDVLLELTNVLPPGYLEESNETMPADSPVEAEPPARGGWRTWPLIRRFFGR